jgi:hypothetical protein
MDDYWLCTDCLASNRPAASGCANCGSRRVVADPARLCPNCGMAAIGLSCAACGYSIARPAGSAGRNIILVLALGLVVGLGGIAGVVALERLPDLSMAAPSPAPSGVASVTSRETPPATAAPVGSPLPSASPRAAGATPGPTVTPNVRPTTTPAASPTTKPTASPAASPEARPAATKPRSRQCRDDTYELYPDRWRWADALEWRFNSSSVPESLDAEKVLAVIQASFENVTEARNECGRPDNVGATAKYLGTTDRVACGPRDGHSVVSFGPMPAGSDRDTIAVTCTYATGIRIVEADIVINEDEPWALSADRCRRQQLILEATVTHEVGHAFGLDHVGQRKHGHLTMSPKVGACDNGPSTLGLGDLLGLEELYGAD